MQKLLDAYRADASLKLARKITEYNRKRPMCAVLLTAKDGELLTAALHQAHDAFVGNSAGQW